MIRPITKINIWPSARMPRPSTLPLSSVDGRTWDSRISTTFDDFSSMTPISRNEPQICPTPADQIVEQLTERETAVLRYLPTKMSQRDIASELYVSLHTVKTHCAAIYRKLGVGDRKAAVQAARDLHLL